MALGDTVDLTGGEMDKLEETTGTDSHPDPISYATDDKKRYADGGITHPVYDYPAPKTITGNSMENRKQMYKCLIIDVEDGDYEHQMEGILNDGYNIERIIQTPQSTCVMVVFIYGRADTRTNPHTSIRPENIPF